MYEMPLRHAPFYYHWLPLLISIYSVNNFNVFTNIDAYFGMSFWCIFENNWPDLPRCWLAALHVLATPRRWPSFLAMWWLGIDTSISARLSGAGDNFLLAMAVLTNIIARRRRLLSAATTRKRYLGLMAFRPPHAAGDYRSIAAHRLAALAALRLTRSDGMSASGLAWRHVHARVDLSDQSFSSFR